MLELGDSEITGHFKCASQKNNRKLLQVQAKVVIKKL